MHRRIDAAVRRIRQDLSKLTNHSTVQRVCRQVGYSWRVGVLCPFATLHWLLLQVLCGNTALEPIAMLAKEALTDSAYRQARARLPLAVYQTIPRTVIKALIPETANGQRYEHRTFLIEGSSLSMPDTSELQAHFGQAEAHAPRCGFPVANMVRPVMAEAATRQEVAAGRISLVGALPWLRNPKARNELAALKVNPDRSGRSEPRVRMRRTKEFPVMKTLRSEWRKQLMGNPLADLLSAILQCPFFCARVVNQASRSLGALKSKW